MAANPYDRFESSDLILRDQLAIDRTVLANERTILAYLRSSLTLVIAGLTFLHFIETGFLRFVGLACIPLGVFVGLFGLARFLRMNRLIRSAGRGTAGQPAGSDRATNPASGERP